MGTQRDFAGMSEVLTIDSLIKPASVHCGWQVRSRKRLFQAIAKELVDPAFAEDEEAIDQIYDALVERERLGSTALGEGVAIPHCRTDRQEIFGAFYTLAQPVDFEASDNMPVDLVFVLLVPRDEKKAHILALQRLAGLFSDPSNLALLRQASSDETLHALLLEIDAGLTPTQADRKFA
jgi:PTS system nitrogen regulatory IIA component